MKSPLLSVPSIRPWGRNSSKSTIITSLKRASPGYLRVSTSINDQALNPSVSPRYKHAIITIISFIALEGALGLDLQKSLIIKPALLSLELSILTLSAAYLGLPRLLFRVTCLSQERDSKEMKRFESEKGRNFLLEIVYGLNLTRFPIYEVLSSIFNFFLLRKK